MTATRAQARPSARRHRRAGRGGGVVRQAARCAAGQPRPDPRPRGTRRADRPPGGGGGPRRDSVSRKRRRMTASPRPRWNFSSLIIWTKRARNSCAHRPRVSPPPRNRRSRWRNFCFPAAGTDEARRVLDDFTNRPGDPGGRRRAGWRRRTSTRNKPSRTTRCVAGGRPRPCNRRTPPRCSRMSDSLTARGDAKDAVEPLERALALTPDGRSGSRSSANSSRCSRPPGRARRASHPAKARAGRAVGPAGYRSVETPALGGARPRRRPARTIRCRFISPPCARPPPISPRRTISAAGALAILGGRNRRRHRAAEKAIEIDPGNIPAREFLVTVASDSHRRDLAEQRLREIMALDPSRRAACLRQLAGLEAEDNDLDEALAIYDDLQKSAPGSVEALTDLALAQQRADRWYDALATWERAYALPGLTPAQREDVRRPLLAAYERLDQFPRRRRCCRMPSMRRATSPRARSGSRNLSAFCHKHDLGAWLEKEYQTRLAAQPNDYFTLTASAALAQDAGRERDAYDLLQRAYFSSPDPAGSLRALAERAEALGENEEAICASAPVDDSARTVHGRKPGKTRRPPERQPRSRTPPRTPGSRSSGNFRATRTSWSAGGILRAQRSSRPRA